MTEDHVLTDDELQDVLRALPLWEVREGWLRRTFKTPSWPHTMLLTATIGYVAEAARHHPDLSIGFAQVTVKLQTHRVRAVTFSDVELARRIDEVACWQPPKHHRWAVFQNAGCINTWDRSYSWLIMDDRRSCARACSALSRATIDRAIHKSDSHLLRRFSKVDEPMHRILSSSYRAVFVLGVAVATYIPPAESRARAEEPGTNLARWKLLQTITVQSERYLVFALAFSPDGKLIATGSNAGTQADERNVKLWHVTTGQEGIKLKGHRYPLLTVAFSPDGQTLATSGWGRFVTLWDVATGDERLTIRASTVNVRSLAFSPDGHTLATAATAIGKTQFWDPATGDEKPGPIEPSERVFSLKFSPDGTVLVTTGKDAAIKLWDVQARKVTGVLKGHKEAIFCVAFSPDGKTLASGAGNGDNTLRLWDLTMMKEQAVLPHTFWVSCVAFSPDGKTLCSVGPGSRDTKGELRLWDVRSGKQLRGPLLEGEGDVRCVAFSPDGQILAASFKNRVKLWRVPTE